MQIAHDLYDHVFDGHHMQTINSNVHSLNLKLLWTNVTSIFYLQVLVLLSEVKTRGGKGFKLYVTRSQEHLAVFHLKKSKLSYFLRGV